MALNSNDRTPDPLSGRQGRGKRSEDGPVSPLSAAAAKEIADEHGVPIATATDVSGAVDGGAM